jgi:NADPH:quinone reductase-like Zn-dependent oxidoreductase
MKAVVIQHPLKSDFSNLSIEERPVPKDLSPTQVLIKVKAVSLNARDAQIASGRYPAPIQVQAGIIAGSDAAGDIVAVGKDVSRVKIGDKVTPLFAQSFLHGQYDPDYQKNGLGGGIDGVLSQYFVCDQEGVVPVPKHLDYVQACTSVITVSDDFPFLDSVRFSALSSSRSSSLRFRGRE